MPQSFRSHRNFAPAVLYAMALYATPDASPVADSYAQRASHLLRDGEKMVLVAVTEVETSLSCTMDAVHTFSNQVHLKTW